ncbi:hypothetical protein NQZ79_g2625 [Umbelopsis isabellina]|nr:hypothetical protein NQZ79_g2625 [Umbelopsis isabellina]
MLSTDNLSATSENNQVNYPLKDEKPSIEAENHFSQEQDKPTVDDATAEATLTEPRRFENIVNFRDVGLSCTTKDENGLQRYIKEGILFRSGRLDDASNADLDVLTNVYGIRTIVDLRSETEGKIGSMLADAFPASAIAAVKPSEMVIAPMLPPHIEEKLNKLDSRQVTMTSETIKKGAMHAADNRKASRRKSTVVVMDNLKHEISNSKAGLTTRITYFVNFAGSKYRYHCVLKPCPFLLKLRVFGLMIIGRKPDAIRLIGTRVLQPKGLKGLNRDFIDYCGEQIIQAIRILLASATYPVLVHCTQGKDRTGLVIALVLLLCNVPRDLIVKDYTKTQQGLDTQREVMVAEMAKNGLDPSFSDAPEEVIIDALDYLESKYHGAENYAKFQGMRDDEIRSLRVIFVAEGTTKQANVHNANTVVALRQNGYENLVS